MQGASFSFLSKALIDYHRQQGRPTSFFCKRIFIVCAREKFTWKKSPAFRKTVVPGFCRFTASTAAFNRATPPKHFPADLSLGRQAEPREVISSNLEWRSFVWSKVRSKAEVTVTKVTRKATERNIVSVVNLSAFTAIDRYIKSRCHLASSSRELAGSRMCGRVRFHISDLVNVCSHFPGR